jgi:recombinational DNA repair ATPase RecF
VDRDDARLFWPVKDAGEKLKSQGEVKLHMIQLRMRRKQGSMFKI